MEKKQDRRTTGRVTIPTDVDVVPQTLELLRRWGADAIRDCDGTDYPEELKGVDAKVYSTYYTTRKDNDWARANPDEIQQMYIMTGFRTAGEGPLSIRLMEGLYPDMLTPNTRDDITRWWEVVDRTTGKVVPPHQWRYEKESGCVVLPSPEAYHDYTVSFLAYILWDPVHMYNYVTNGWQGVEHQMTFDVRQPKTHAFTMERLRRFLKEHPYVNVIRYTTFFHQFTLIFDELAREKYVDWYGYSASVSPYILEQFEKEVGYPFRPEYIIDQGYHNNTYRIPSKEFQDFQAFQRREVAKLAKEMVDITHEYGKEAMMFLGDHWIGTEPFMEEFPSIGLDAGGGQCGQRLHPPPHQRYPGGELYRRAFSSLLFPRHLPRGWGSGEGGQDQLGHRPARYPAQAHRSHRLWRLSQVGAGIPRFHRLRGERVRGIPHPLRQHQGHHPLLLRAGGGAQLLGENAGLGQPHGASRHLFQAELFLRRQSSRPSAARPSTYPSSASTISGKTRRCCSPSTWC